MDAMSSFFTSLFGFSGSGFAGFFVGHGPVSISGFQLLFLPSLGIGELSIIFVIILVLFGPGKLPDVCRALGDGVRQFKNASKDIRGEVTGEPVTSERTPENKLPEKKADEAL